jgi:hypothetical protein
MFVKLLKEIPQMFVVAAIIWGFVLFLFIRNSRRKDKVFFARHRSTLIAVLAALVLTIADIWLFTSYIPTHFKKHPVVDASLSTTDLLADSVLQDSIRKPMAEINKKDSAKKEKAVIPELNAKTYLTNKASIHFMSHGSSEDIEATNQMVACSLNSQTGQLRFTGLIRGFVFENEIMQEHFNDKDYMNSEAFPKTNFTGTIQNIQTVNFTKDGNYPVTAIGALSIHGVTKNMTVTGTVMIAGSKVTMKSIFKIKRIDFGITTDEIADELEITVIAGLN